MVSRARGAGILADAQPERTPDRACTLDRAVASPPDVALDLFAPLPGDYERWAAVLSFGQDGRWRRAMLEQLALAAGEMALDVAAGTGLITRALGAAGLRVVSVDQSPAMLEQATLRGATGVVATGERLPFADESFDVVTFGYLLRYVDDVTAAVAELARVLRPGGRMGMVEFGRPGGLWGPPWIVYTRVGLPAAGAMIGRPWLRVGRFLGPSIDAFAAAWPPGRLAGAWEAAGLSDVSVRRMSLGGGLVMAARKP
jgi:demethylmenaquinone methyltransferase / 2-methoxy-6-polyprenyl-1,4-benzoquinol methylase